MSVRGTKVTSTVLAATEFRNFNVKIITLTHLTFKVNATVDFRYFLCVTRSSAAMEVSSFHVPMRYVKRSSNLINKPYQLTAHADNPSYTRAAEN